MKQTEIWAGLLNIQRIAIFNNVFSVTGRRVISNPTTPTKLLLPEADRNAPALIGTTDRKEPSQTTNVLSGSGPTSRVST